MELSSIFITGLFAGGLTCLAVQGGLLASSIAQQESRKLKDEAVKGHTVPVLSFLITRLIAYTLLGLLLGSLGSVVQLSLTARVILQFGAAIFMVGTALNLLNVHPIFRYFVIQSPKSLTKLVKNQSKSKAIFGPAILGATTVLIPCGATQAMMAYALSTGSPITGAVTMFAFILGTSPLFYLLGYATKKLIGTAQEAFNNIAAFAIIIIALYNVYGAIALTGNQFTVRNFLTGVQCAISFCPQDSVSGVNTQFPVVSEATVYITSQGYTTQPAVLNVKAGSKVKLNLVNQGGGGCVQAFTMPKLNIQQVIPMGKSDVVEFTAPNEKGKLAFMCSMGMFQGTINVI